MQSTTQHHTEQSELEEIQSLEVFGSIELPTDLPVPTITEPDLDVFAGRCPPGTRW